MNILVFSNHYLPGYKAGGPIKTLSNMVERLGDEFHFSIITRDRDLGDTNSYPNIKVNSWQQVGKAQVMYLTPNHISIKTLYNLLNSTLHDVVYLNNIAFSFFIIIPLILRCFRLIRRVPFIIAPRGVFSPGALRIKKYKKQPYFFFARMLGLYRNLIWQVSSKHEKEELLNYMKLDVQNTPIVVASNMTAFRTSSTITPSLRMKQRGILKIAFLSRIARKKNLSYALNQLREVKGNVRFHIYGLLEDSQYWLECQKYIGVLSDNIQVKYVGAVEPKQVVNILSQYHLFFFPTLGENFGHVILEALIAGCPVLISDRTAWKGLEEKGIGWSLPLEKPEQFRAILRKCVNMDGDEFGKWSHGAYTFAQQYLNDDIALEQNRALFREAAMQDGVANPVLHKC